MTKLPDSSIRGGRQKAAVISGPAEIIHYFEVTIEGSQNLARGNLIHWNKNSILFIFFTWFFKNIYAQTRKNPDVIKEVFVAYKQQRNYLVGVNKALEGGLLHRWDVTYLQQGTHLCQHKQQPVWFQREKRVLWNSPSDHHEMPALAC